MTTINKRLNDLERSVKPKGEPRFFVYYRDVDDRIYTQTLNGVKTDLDPAELDRLRADPDVTLICVSYYQMGTKHHNDA